MQYHRFWRPGILMSIVLVLVSEYVLQCRAGVGFPFRCETLGCAFCATARMRLVCGAYCRQRCVRNEDVFGGFTDRISTRAVPTTTTSATTTTTRTTRTTTTRKPTTTRKTTTTTTRRPRTTTTQQLTTPRRRIYDLWFPSRTTIPVPDTVYDHDLYPIDEDPDIWFEPPPITTGTTRQNLDFRQRHSQRFRIPTRPIRKIPTTRATPAAATTPPPPPTTTTTTISTTTSTQSTTTTQPFSFIRDLLRKIREGRLFPKPTTTTTNTTTTTTTTQRPTTTTTPTKYRIRTRTTSPSWPVATTPTPLQYEAPSILDDIHAVLFTGPLSPPMYYDSKSDDNEKDYADSLYEADNPTNQHPDDVIYDLQDGSSFVPRPTRPVVPYDNRLDREQRRINRLKSALKCPKPDWSPCVPQARANERFYECCVEHGLDPGCLEVCKYDVDQDTLDDTFFWRRTCPMSQLSTYMYCASGGQDARACCRARAIINPIQSGAICDAFCNPTDGLPHVTPIHRQCMLDLAEIHQCFRAHLQPLPPSLRRRASTAPTTLTTTTTSTTTTTPRPRTRAQPIWLRPRPGRRPGFGSRLESRPRQGPDRWLYRSTTTAVAPWHQSYTTPSSPWTTQYYEHEAPIRRRYDNGGGSVARWSPRSRPGTRPSIIVSRNRTASSSSISGPRSRWQRRHRQRLWEHYRRLQTRALQTHQ